MRLLADLVRASARCSTDGARRGLLLAQLAVLARLNFRPKNSPPAEKISLPIVMQYAHFLEQLPATIDSLTTGSETAVHLPLKLDLLPAMLQYLLSTGQLSREHVAYQSLERLCLLALNKDDMMPTNHFAPLLEFAVAQHNMFGASCAHFMHGQGCANGATADDPASFLALHNSGQHSVNTIARNLPPADVGDVGHLHSLLNFFAAARAEALDAVFCPARGRVVVLAFLAFDGLMLGAGAMVDEAREHIVGFTRPIAHEEAEELLASLVDDTAMQRMLAANRHQNPSIFRHPHDPALLPGLGHPRPRHARGGSKRGC